MEERCSSSLRLLSSPACLSSVTISPAHSRIWLPGSWRDAIWCRSGRICRVSPSRLRCTWPSVYPSDNRFSALASASKTWPRAALSPHSSPIEKSSSSCKITLGASSRRRYGAISLSKQLCNFQDSVHGRKMFAFAALRCSRLKTVAVQDGICS